jgi:hypothetical protein
VYVTRLVQDEAFPSASTALAKMVVAVLAPTLLVNVIPGLANAALDCASERGVVQVPSKYSVTVDVSDAVPRIVGVNELFGLVGEIDENASVGAVVSIVTVLSIDVDAAF